MRIQNEMIPEVILKEVGHRLAQARIDLGLTQAEAAHRAGLGKRTVERIESGADSQLSTLFRLLRVVGLLDRVETLIPEPDNRPMDLLKLGQRQRKRAPRTRSRTEKREWRWGDEE